MGQECQNPLLLFPRPCALGLSWLARMEVKPLSSDRDSLLRGWGQALARPAPWLREEEGHAVQPRTGQK